jgi:hypothetical protein
MVMNKTLFPLLLALGASPAVLAQPPADDTELEPMTVTAPPRPSWDRTDRQLRLMLDKSSPCLGCDAARAGPAALGWQDYLLQPVGEVDEATTLARHVKLQDSPDLQYLRR